MKAALATLIAWASLAIVNADTKADPNSGPLKQRAGYFYDHRPRLGHFKVQPYTDLYNHYAEANVRHMYSDKERPEDSFENYLPSGDECVIFFRKFRVDKYTVRDFDELVVLDACLGYLYESQKYHEEDMEKSKALRDDLQHLIDDRELERLYRDTQIDQFEKLEPKECIGNLLTGTIQAKHQYKAVACNSDFIQLYIQFAECHDTIPNWRELKETDSYLNVIYDLLKRRGLECFDYEIESLNAAVRGNYVNNPFRHFKNKASSVFPWKKLAEQRGDRLWPEPITKLLDAVQGGNGLKINIRYVHQLIRGVSQNDPKLRRVFLDNMSAYATKRIKTSNEIVPGDQYGHQRYADLVDRLCNYFRSSNADGYVDFATPFIRMIRMLNHEDVFGIGLDYFIGNVFARSYETAPLYMSVSSCNLLTFTIGQLDQAPQNRNKRFIVEFKPDTSQMIQWPDAGYY